MQGVFAQGAKWAESRETWITEGEGVAEQHSMEVKQLKGLPIPVLIPFLWYKHSPQTSRNIVSEQSGGENGWGEAKCTCTDTSHTGCGMLLRARRIQDPYLVALPKSKT